MKRADSLREIGAALPVPVALKLRAMHATHGADWCTCLDLMLGPAVVHVQAQPAAAVAGAEIKGV